MGHERTGSLPKSQRWRDLVEQIAHFGAPGDQIPDIARQTLRNVRSRLRQIDRDTGVKAAFEFLLNLAVALRSQNAQQALSATGIQASGQPTPLSLAKALSGWVAARQGSAEYGGIAQGAAADAIAEWSRKRQDQGRLFSATDDPFEAWHDMGTGSGFCEVARLYFARLTERHLNYYLEREASAVLPSIEERDNFQKHLRQHLEEISQHAFETARITQSFAAGWFNRNTARGVPGDKEITGFLLRAFGKIREELLREAENNG